MLSFFDGLIYIFGNSDDNFFFFFVRILTIISSNENALKVLGEVMSNLEDGGSVSFELEQIKIWYFVLIILFVKLEI